MKNKKNKNTVLKKEYFTEKEIMSTFKQLDVVKQNKILKKALRLALDNRAGTKAYAIANSMGYIYQDDGSYTK